MGCSPPISESISVLLKTIFSHLIWKLEQELPNTKRFSTYRKTRVH